MTNTELVHLSDDQRFEYRVDGELAAFEDYRRVGDTIAFVHTEGLPGFKGAARELVRGILDDAKAQQLQVLPHCSYVAKVIRDQPADYLDLVPVEQRAQFDLPA